jgi:RimJ/RimL family protein N-acetyltransferase
MSVDVTLRRATMADADVLLKWRNDALTRQFSLNPAEVSKQQHLQWLQRSLNSATRQLFIAEHGGRPVGTARVDSDGQQHMISWTLAPEQRGKGLAKLMVRNLVLRLSGTIVAQILPGNLASVKVAEYAGLSYQHTDNGIMYFVKNTIAMAQLKD